ncbi:Malonyl-[acyl-carrier protein] O-methyltransferase [Bienertia sinuspersici]
MVLVLSEYIVQDLNVSVDYLTKPLEVFKEMHRILKPGGLAIMSFSNRCFWTKAISIWTSTGDTDHALIVGAYFHYAGGFGPPKWTPTILTSQVSNCIYLTVTASLDHIVQVAALNKPLKKHLIIIEATSNSILEKVHLCSYASLEGTDF